VKDNTIAVVDFEEDILLFEDKFLAAFHTQSEHSLIDPSKQFLELNVLIDKSEERECLSMSIFDKNFHVLQVSVIDGLANVKRLCPGNEDRNADHDRL
jgi:hypothetical protein